MTSISNGNPNIKNGIIFHFSFLYKNIKKAMLVYFIRLVYILYFNHI